MDSIVHEKVGHRSIKVAIAITAVVVAAAVICAWVFWEGFACMTPNEWGDFIAGIFGLLGFIWLVAGYYYQADELRQQVAVLRDQQTAQKKQADELAEQTQALKDSVHNQAEALRLQMEESKLAAERELRAAEQERRAADRERRELERDEPKFKGVVVRTDGGQVELKIVNQGPQIHNVRILEACGLAGAFTRGTAGAGELMGMQVATLHETSTMTIRCRPAPNGEYGVWLKLSYQVVGHDRRSKWILVCHQYPHVRVLPDSDEPLLDLESATRWITGEI